MNHISRLDSYLHWQKVIGEQPDRFPGYTFPQPYQAWAETQGSDCPVCHDWRSGFVDTPQGKKNIYCICSTLRWLQASYFSLHEYETPIRPASLNDLGPIGVPPEADRDLTTLLDFIGKWLVRPTLWFIIQGGNGSGKSHILRAIKTQLNGLAAYISTDRFQQKLFSIREDSGKIQSLIDSLSTIPILLLDDWGLEHESSWTTDTLASIVNRRYMFPEEFPTVVTFNTPLGTLLTSPNPAKRRIISRLIDTDISKVFQLRQADYRTRMTKNAGGIK